MRSSVSSSKFNRMRKRLNLGATAARLRRARFMSSERERAFPVPREDDQMAKKRGKRKYSRGSQKEVENEMHRYKRGKAKSGRGGKGKVKSRKQAIAISFRRRGRREKNVPTMLRSDTGPIKNPNLRRRSPVKFKNGPAGMGQRGRWELVCGLVSQTTKSHYRSGRFTTT